MAQLDKKQKLWLTISICGLIILIYTGLIIYPQISDLLATNNKIAQQQATLSELNTKKNDLKSAKDQEENADYILKQFSVHLTTQKDILDFIIQLEDIAKRTNNTQEITIAAEEETPQIKQSENEEANAPAQNQENTNNLNQTNQSSQPESIDIKINLTGSFEALINYLAELSKAPILSDQISLDSQLASLISTEAGQQITNDQEAINKSEITTALNLKVYLNATK